VRRRRIYGSLLLAFGPPTVLVGTQWMMTALMLGILALVLVRVVLWLPTA
jgi:hypothetical protein